MAHIGILGGSFDPVHNGHLTIAQAVRRAARLDRVWLMPAQWSPLKNQHEAATGEHRLAMLHLAVDGQEGLQVSDLELSRPGRSYTFDTLRHLSQAHPEHEFSWIIGADNLPSLLQWYHARELISGWRFWIAARPGHHLEADFVRIKPLLGSELTDQLRQGVLDTSLVDISATRVRQAVQKGEPITAWVDPRVADYITRHGLYRTTRKTEG